MEQYLNRIRSSIYPPIVSLVVDALRHNGVEVVRPILLDLLENFLDSLTNDGYKKIMEEHYRPIIDKLERGEEVEYSKGDRPEITVTLPAMVQ